MKWHVAESDSLNISGINDEEEGGISGEEAALARKGWRYLKLSNGQTRRQQGNKVEGQAWGRGWAPKWGGGRDGGDRPGESDLDGRTEWAYTAAHTRGRAGGGRQALRHALCGRARASRR